MNNIEYFNNIDTEQKAYWLGFLYADGCVRTVNPGKRLHYGVRFGLHTKDEKAVVQLKKDLGVTNKLYYAKKQPLVTLEVSSKPMHTALIKHGCIPKKSNTLEPPKNIPKSLIRHFVRGYFDGDGWIFKRNTGKYTRYEVGWCGTEAFIVWIKQTTKLSNKLYHNTSTTNFGTPNLWSVATSDLNIVKELYHYLYEDASRCLERKKEIFKEACAVYEQKLVENNRAKTEKADKVLYGKIHGKVCSKCAEIKPNSQYNKHYGQTYDGLQTICKQCIKKLYYPPKEPTPC